jgi:hypothetical protein
MAMHRTFAHAAADLRRQSLLAEAENEWRSRPEHERLHVRPRRFALHQWLERAEAIVSRIVDDFEGNAGSPRTGSQHRSLRLPSVRSVR